MTASIFHTLREGRTVAKHPTLGVLVSDLGEVLTKLKGWSYGHISTYGYPSVTLNKKERKIHIIEAEAFLPNPEHKPTVDHHNRIRQDNRLINLSWATFKEQANNTANVERMDDYGIRKCDNLLQYKRNYMHVYTKRNKDRLNQKRRINRYFKRMETFLNW